jgi:hypothetical protein
MPTADVSSSMLPVTDTLNVFSGTSAPLSVSDPPAATVGPALMAILGVAYMLSMTLIRVGWTSSLPGETVQDVAASEVGRLGSAVGRSATPVFAKLAEKETVSSILMVFSVSLSTTSVGWMTISEDDGGETETVSCILMVFSVSLSTTCVGWMTISEGDGGEMETVTGSMDILLGKLKYSVNDVDTLELGVTTSVSRDEVEVDETPE